MPYAPVNVLAVPWHFAGLWQEGTAGPFLRDVGTIVITGNNWIVGAIDGSAVVSVDVNDVFGH